MENAIRTRETYISPEVESIRLAIVPGEALMSPKGNPEGYENGDDYEW